MADPSRPKSKRSASPAEPAAGGASWRSRLLAAAGFLTLSAMVGAVWLFTYWEPRLLPIRVIEVDGQLHHHSSQLLQATITERLRGGILTADLADLKGAAEALPWVGSASIRRVWPDRLKVQVSEHRPIARWNSDGLVTAEGIVFHPSAGSMPQGLPLLEGDDKRAPEVVKRFLAWRDRLSRAGHLIHVLAADPRGDWRAELVGGVELRLGTGPVDDRLERFIASAAQLEAAGKLRSVDLRYSNGFAVTWVSSTDGQIRATSGRTARSRHRG